MATKRPKTLFARAMTALAGALALCALLTVPAVFFYALDEAEDNQDDRLEEVAAALARADLSVESPQALLRHHLRAAKPGRHRSMMMHEPPAPELPGTAVPDDDDDWIIPAGRTVIVRLLQKKGRGIEAVFDRALESDTYTVTLKDRDYRIAVLILDARRYVIVGEPLSVRNDAALNQAATALLPFALVLPLSVLVVGFVLWRSLTPVKRVAKELDAREATDFSCVAAAELPADLVPFVDAVNHMLAKVEALRAREVRFTADAAHELRSPLTALLITAERLAASDLPPKDRDTVALLQAGLERSVRQVSQLLALARAQGTQDALVADTPWEVESLLADTLEPLMRIVGEKAIDFEVEGLESLTKQTFPRSAFEPVLRNLVENALHYTPAKGRVRVLFKESASALTFSVTDTGPGIAPEERERVFDPFYRVLGRRAPGTGLGLSIVKTFVDALEGRIELTDAKNDVGHGLCATVTLPKARWRAKAETAKNLG